MLRHRFALAAALLVMLLTVPVHAADFVDDMSVVDNNSIHIYENLSPLSLPPALMKLLPDPTFLSFADLQSPVASVTYRVQGADSVRVGIYTAWGTYISGSSSISPPVTVLGTDEAQPPAALLALPRALYSPDQQKVYADLSGGWHSIFYRSYVYVDVYEFQPCAAPGGSLIDYGVNVYAVSASGQSTRLSGQRTDIRFTTGVNYIYEEFVFAPPASAQSIRIEINDFKTVGIHGGGTFSKPKNAMTSLAEVTLSGTAMTLGEPEPIVAEEQKTEQNEQSSSQSPAYSSAGIDKDRASSQKAASSASSTTSASKSAQSSSVSFATPKFEGYAVMPSSSGSSEKSAESASPTDPPIPVSAQDPPPAAIAEQAAFRVAPAAAPTQASRANVAVLAYIVCVGGAILFVALRVK